MARCRSGACARPPRSTESNSPFGTERSLNRKDLLSEPENPAKEQTWNHCCLFRHTRDDEALGVANLPSKGCSTSGPANSARQQTRNGRATPRRTPHTSRGVPRADYESDNFLRSRDDGTNPCAGNINKTRRSGRALRGWTTKGWRTTYPLGRPKRSERGGQAAPARKRSTLLKSQSAHGKRPQKAPGTQRLNERDSHTTLGAPTGELSVSFFLPQELSW